MIKLASPDIREEDIRRAVEVMQSGNLVQGENVAAFETELEQFTRISHCAVVSSGTAALHLALMALEISAGDAVIVPAFTFPATANAVINTGADVILCDVSPDAYVMTPEVVEETILKHTAANLKAVIVVHEFGFPAEIAAIRAITEKYHLKLIEDAACALGTNVAGHHPGYYSDVACFSFHPRKAITSGDGGAVLTGSRNLAEKVKILRNHGMSVTDDGPDYIKAGLNYRMTDFQAALVRGQLVRFPEELTKRKKLAKLYHELLKDMAKLKLPRTVEGHSWQSYMTVLDKEFDRYNIIRALADKGVEANLGAQALHQLAFYQKKYGFKNDAFKNAAVLYEYGLVLPIYGKLKSFDIELISQALIEVLNGY